MYKESSVNVKCVKCGSTFSMHKVTRRRKIRENPDNPQYICPNCNKIASSKRNKERWKSMPQAEKDAIEKRLELSRIKFIENVDKETRLKINKKISSKRKLYWSNMSEADRIAFGNNHKKWWDSLTPEERERQFEPMRKGFLEWYHNLSDEDRAECIKKKIAASEEYWNNMTEEERDKWIIKRCHENSDNLPNNPNELSFVEILNQHGIQYEMHKYNKIKHPDFDKLFPFNKITGAKIVMPYHQWDFLIHLIDRDVFIDIDGSIHITQDFTINYYTGIKVNIKDVNLYNDSQRPYQTDGLDAYIVQCYNDNMAMDTPVLNVTTNEVMKLYQLLAILDFGNKTNSEQFEIGKIIGKI